MNDLQKASDRVKAAEEAARQLQEKNQMKTGQYWLFNRMGRMLANLGASS